MFCLRHADCLKRSRRCALLRITVQKEAGHLTLKVEGEVVGPWVHELEACWEAAKHDPEGKPILIDLNAVTFFDLEGQALLGRLRGQGVELIATDLMMGWIQDLSSNLDN